MSTLPPQIPEHPERAASFTLDCGFGISLHELKQKLVYEGLLEGLPTRERNQGYVRRTIQTVRQESGHVPVTLLDPVAKPIVTKHPYPFGEPESVPGVLCVGRFRSNQCTAASDYPDEEYSELVVIWFQDEFGLPISVDVQEQLQRMDWDTLAGNFAD